MIGSGQNMALLSDDALEKLERSRAYLVVDILFGWIGGIGLFLFFVISIHWWNRYSERGPDPRFYFWLKVLLWGVVLSSAGCAKDQILAWAGIAPPDHEKWLGPKQIGMAGIDPTMDLILHMQYRATRIRKRGIRVDQLLAENEAIFLRKQGKQN